MKIIPTVRLLGPGSVMTLLLFTGSITRAEEPVPAPAAPVHTDTAASSTATNTPAKKPAMRFTEPDPLDFNDHEGYVPLFDGVSLKGWDGNVKFWRV